MVCTFVLRDGRAACDVHNVDLVFSPNLGGWACPVSHIVFPWGTELGTAIHYGDAHLGINDEVLHNAVRTILRGFDEGIFVRSTDNDLDPAWAIKLFPFIQALAVAQRYLKERLQR
jgi:hypothetical protein